MLPKGKFPWYSPALSMSDEASLVFNKIAKRQEIPHLPTAIMEIQQMLANPDIEIADLCKAVKMEPFIAAEIIKVAENLKSYRSSDNLAIKSLEHAITYIGRKSLSDLVIAASVKAFKLPTQKFDEDRFWEHSFLTAAIAEILAVKFNHTALKDKMYLGGCLCNIGKVMQALFFPKETDMLYDYVYDLKTQTTWEKAELHFGTVSHTILGEIGAAFWGLPQFVMDSARNHHKHPDAIVRLRQAQIIEVTAFANILAHWVMLEPHRIDEEVLKNHAKSFGIDEKGLEDLTLELSKIRRIKKSDHAGAA